VDPGTARLEYSVGCTKGFRPIGVGFSKADRVMRLVASHAVKSSWVLLFDVVGKVGPVNPHLLVQVYCLRISPTRTSPTG